MCQAIHPAKLALWIMRTHQRLDLLHGGKACVDNARLSAVISTYVPSSGRQAHGNLEQQHLIGDEQPADSVGDVAARKGRARDVPDVLAEPKCRARTLADELLSPSRIANLASVGLAIFEDLDPLDRAVGLSATA